MSKLMVGPVVRVENAGLDETGDVLSLEQYRFTLADSSGVLGSFWFRTEFDAEKAKAAIVEVAGRTAWTSAHERD